MSNIIGTFSNKGDIFVSFPKLKSFNLKDIFNDYWDDFLVFASIHNYNIRPVVIHEVDKMLKCKSPSLGYNLFKCPNCNHEHFQYNTCKCRFCSSCGIKYSNERSLSISSKLINCNHRHLVFTIPDVLWPFLREDRSRLNILFEAVNITLSSWFGGLNKSLNFKPGFILYLHTFGRDNKWNTHIHCLIAEMAIGKNNIYRKIDFFPYDMLRKRFQTVFLDLLEDDIGKDIFRPIKNSIYLKSKNGFYVRAKKNQFPSTKKALDYILRYCSRPAFASSRIISIEDNYITFWYQRHEDNMFIVERIHVFEFIERLIIHIPNYQFKTIRYYGFYSSRCSRLYDCFKKLLDKSKLSFYRNLNKWRLLLIFTFKRDPLVCPNCGTIMEFVYVFT